MKKDIKGVDDMILVTGASGNVGKHVVRLLSRQGVPVLAASRCPESQQDIHGVEWVRWGFGDDARSIMKNVSGVVLISPAHRGMVAHQKNVVDAARLAGVKKITKLSGLGAGPDAPIRLPASHYEIEQYVESAIPNHSFVRPNLFMQVLLGSADTIKRDGQIYAPAGKGKISFIDAEDVAKVLVSEVMKDGSSVAEITGPESLDYEEVATVIGEVLQRPVQYTDVSPEQARASMLAAGMDEWLTEAYLELFEIYRQGLGASVLADRVRAVTGVEPSSFRNFVSRSTGAFA